LEPFFVAFPLHYGNLTSVFRHADNDASHGSSLIAHRTIFAALFLLFSAYSAYVYTAGTKALNAEPMNDRARHGQQLFQRNNCTACHQIYGLGGYMGPDLTNVISRRGRAYASAFLAAGTQRMPNFHFKQAEISALLAYLDFVDATGTYPPTNYHISWLGTVSQADDPR